MPSTPPPLPFEYGDESSILERDALIYVKAGSQKKSTLVVAYVGPKVRAMLEELARGGQPDPGILPEFIIPTKENMETLGRDVVFFSYLDQQESLKSYCISEGLNLLYGGECGQLTEAKQAVRTLSQTYYAWIDALAKEQTSLAVPRTRSLEKIVGVDLEAEFELRKKLQKGGLLPRWKDLGSIDFELHYQFHHPHGVFYRKETQKSL